MRIKSTFLRSYAFSLVLIVSIVIGSVLGVIFKQGAAALKPLGDIFLNLLFMTIVPLVFFSISSAVASMTNVTRLCKILACMMLVFVATGIIASALMVVAVKVYPPAAGIKLTLGPKPSIEQSKTAEQVLKAFTVPDFVELLSKRNMLALIVFAVLVGLASSAAGEKGKAFTAFLSSANEVLMKAISYIMFYAPIGLCAYFAYLVGVFGPRLLGAYLRAIVLYYPVSILYFLAAFSFYAYLAGRARGVKSFWSNIIPPSLMALATGSSVAAIPTNIEAADRIGVPKDIGEVVIPIGATIHMDGSCLSAVLKIALLFGLFNIDFSGFETIATAIGIALLSGIVMSGIPGGGFTGELLIITMYDFPLEAMPIISMIGTLVDPPATMVNAVGDNVVSMMIARILGGKDWMNKKP